MGRYKERETTKLSDKILPPQTYSFETEDTKTGRIGKGAGFTKKEASDNAWKDLKFGEEPKYREKPKDRPISSGGGGGGGGGGGTSGPEGFTGCLITIILLIIVTSGIIRGLDYLGSKTEDLINRVYPAYETSSEKALRLTIERNTEPAYLPVTQEIPQGRIIFVSNRGGNQEIYSMNSDGTNQVNLTSHSSQDWDPAPSPDGKKIAFVSNRSGNPEIYVMNSDGSDPVRLPMIRYSGVNPAWVSNSEIVFVHCPGSYQSWIFLKGVGKLEELPETFLLPNQYNERDRNFEEYAHPAVSPDGRNIAFVKYTRYIALVSPLSLRTEVFISDLGGSREMSFAAEGSLTLSPQAWSPDGERIVFSFDSRIGILEPESQHFLWFTSHKVTYLVDGKGNVSGERPSWSPDGNWIVFDNKGGIYILEVASGGIRKLTEDRFLNYGPTWIQ